MEPDPSSTSTPDELITLVQDLPPLYWAIAAIVVVLLILGIRLIFRRSPAHLTAYAGTSGTVQISRKAIQTLIKQACSTDELVEAAKPTVKIAGDKVDTHVELRLTSPANLKVATERIQAKISSLLEKSLNIEQIGQIRIVVVSFGTQDAKDSGDAPPVAESDLTPDNGKR